MGVLHTSPPDRLEASYGGPAMDDDKIRHRKDGR